MDNGIYNDISIYHKRYFRPRKLLSDRGGVVYNYHLVIIVHSSDRLLSRGGRNNNQHDIDVYLLRFYFQFHWTM